MNSIGKPNALQKIKEFLQGNFDHIDAVISCAGMIMDLTKVEDIDSKTMQKMLQINVLGNLPLINSVHSLLLAAPTGVFAFINDAGILSPRPFWSSYDASKTAMRAIIQNYKLENTHHRNLSVLEIFVGQFDSKVSRAVLPGRAKHFVGSDERAKEVIRSVEGELLI